MSGTRNPAGVPREAKHSAESLAANPGRRSTWNALEVATLVHVGVFIVATTWLFGGQADWIRAPLAGWGSIGVLITLAALGNREARHARWLGPLRWTWPFLAFNALVLVSCLNPSLREVSLGAEPALINTGGHAGWPSTARPANTLAELWLFDAIWLACFNLTLVVRQRRALRIALILAVANAATLSIFGTAQKLVQARGLFFDAVPSPQKQFFSSFVYHNHWGAFAVLMLTTCIGLIWHYTRRREPREVLHSPAMSLVVIGLLIAVTVPLSTSRSCTLLAGVVLTATLLHGLRHTMAVRRRHHESILPPLATIGTAVALTLGAMWYVGSDSIIARVAKTEEQVQEMRETGTIGDRAVLYRNTWRMAAAKPWFGWGMASYPHIFTLFNSRSHTPIDNLPVFYHDAHSDWLQSLAEHGFIGSALLALCAIVPLVGLRRHLFTRPLPTYLLGGCGLILLYAWIEFPFGNVAVVLSWWFCFFAAVQYVRLQVEEAKAAGSDLPNESESASGAKPVV